MISQGNPDLNVNDIGCWDFQEFCGFLLSEENVIMVKIFITSNKG